VQDAGFRHALVFDSLTLCAGGLMADGKRFEAGNGGIVLPLSAAYRPVSPDTRIAPRALAIDLTGEDHIHALSAAFD
jgi:hypothetical protein